MSPTNGIIYQALIQSNCQIFLGNHVEIDVVSQLDVKGKWTAHVLKTGCGERISELSASASTLHDAFEDLHKKSAMAVNQYVAANGFNTVRDPCRKSHRSRSGRKKSKRHASVESLPTLAIGCSGSSSSDSETTSSEDNDASSLCSERSVQPQTSSKRGENAVMKVNNEAPGIITTHRPIKFGPQAMPAPPAAAAIGRRTSPIAIPLPPQHRGYPVCPPQNRMPPGLILPPSAARKNGNPPPSQFSQMPGQSPTLPKPKPKTCQVLLCIDWASHGKTTIADDCILSINAIKIRATQLIRTRGHEFSNVAPWDLSPEAIASLRVTVKQVYISADACFSLTDFLDDLSALYVEPPQFLRFIIEARSGLEPPRSVSSSLSDTVAE